MIKVCHRTLVLLLLLSLVLVTACGGEPEPTQEPLVTVTSEATEGPVETEAPIETEGPVETEGPEIEGEPELVWSHKHENNIHRDRKSVV